MASDPTGIVKPDGLPTRDTPQVLAGMALAAALEAANYGGDSGEDVDRLIAELAKRGYRLTSDADDDEILRAVDEARRARAEPDAGALRAALDQARIVADMTDRVTDDALMSEMMALDSALRDVASDAGPEGTA